ncbi:MAG: deoxyguanosinetriphosphate triphosphohydrolase, partial [Planctomycetes bacterium]|nr:deoxyguanosinetriphosphate triphosphohydrolase [Planctomycetota bacterium]
PDFRGLNLTWELRESILKHNRPFEGPEFEGYEPERGPLLEAQLVDLCDGVAYLSHDLDDGLTSGILERQDVDALEMIRVVAARVEARWPAIDGKMRQKKCVSQVIDHLIHDLVATSVRRLEVLGIRHLDDVRAQTEPILEFSAEVRRQEEELRDFLYQNFYTDFRVHRMRNRARVFVEGLFREFTDNPRLMPPKYQARVAEEGLHRTVADYIAGMTDGYAEDEYRKLLNP